MRIDVVTVFPEMIESFVRHGVLGRAIQRKLLTVSTWNPRDFTEDKHATVDDRPYGGGPGMLMMVKPLRKSLRSAKSQQRGNFRTIYLSPQGRVLDQHSINRLATLDGLVLLSGRYKGVDERLIDLEIDAEWSLGDYVISGGEPAAMVLIDAVARQREGVLGDEDSAKVDSFMTGLLDCPHYTRPVEYEGRTVPDVLLGGNHEAIRRWRLKQSLGRTLCRRRDLLRRRSFSKEERELIVEYARENGLDFSAQSMDDGIDD